ncbi:MAG: TolB family protein [Terriglobales bacterium]
MQSISDQLALIASASKQIVFSILSLGLNAKLYMVPSDGGSARQIIPEDSGVEADPTWSPDGTRIAFGGAAGDRTAGVRIVDIKTHQVSILPGSNGLFSPRWSPDGRYIVAMPYGFPSLMLFDFRTQKWEEIAKITNGFPNWSKSGEYVYFLHQEKQPSVMRLSIRDRKLERVVDLKNFRQAGLAHSWLGLAPDDSPLLLRDTGTQDIYALDWQAP